jgi:HAD superfamily phosphatase (TIGR01668 family)
MCFRPDTQALALQNVNLYVMRHVGVRALFLDADNTVAPWNSQEVSEPVRAWVRAAKEAGFAVMVVSNNHMERLQGLSQRLEIHCIPKMRKPLPFRLRRLARSLSLKPNQCAMIGDQILTDVLAGNLAGMHTVLLRPIDMTQEYAGTRINRKLERVIKKLLKII